MTMTTVYNSSDKTSLCNGTHRKGILSNSDFRIPVIVLLSCTLACTIFGNILVIRTVVKRDQYRQRTNVFVVSLAAADLSVAIFVMSFSILQQCSDIEWFHQNSTYLISWGLDVMFTTTSILHLTCMTIDRYVAVSQPFKYFKIMRRKRVIFLLFLCWFLSAMISLGLMMIKFDELNSITEYCRVTFVFRVNAVCAVIASLASFYLPSVFMIFCNIRIFSSIRKRGRKLRHLTANYICMAQRDQQVQNELKVARTIAILLGCFLLCWLPFFTINIIEPLLEKQLPAGAWVIITWLGYINSTLNPYLYYFLNRKTKEKRNTESFKIWKNRMYLVSVIKSRENKYVVNALFDTRL